MSSSSVVREALAAIATPSDRKLFDLYALVTKYTSPMDLQLPNDQEFVNTFKLHYEEHAFGRKTADQTSQDIYDLIQRMLAK
jgi:hypothetical protein